MMAGGLAARNNSNYAAKRKSATAELRSAWTGQSPVPTRGYVK